MNQTRVTIVEIAKEAGVSAQTVSRVVNGRTNVAPETREKIKAIITRRGYHPSRLARSLLRGYSNAIGVVSYGLEFYGTSQTLAGIVKEANRQGYSVIPIVLDAPETSLTTANRIMGELIEYHVDGIIWAIPEIGNNCAWIQLAADLPTTMPLVFLTINYRPDLTVIAVDNRAGGRMATQHLINRGCRTIGLIKGLWGWEAQERAQGWYDAMHENNIPINNNLIMPGNWSALTGELCMRQLLETHPEIDGIFVSNDSMAVGALKAAREFGRNVPADLAIVGFDDIPEAAYFYPALTTIHQNLHQLGGMAVAELNRLIRINQEDKILPTAPVLLTPQLVIRDSA